LTLSPKERVGGRILSDKKEKITSLPLYLFTSLPLYLFTSLPLYLFTSLEVVIIRISSI
jgi:hypothetical protein